MGCLRHKTVLLPHFIVITAWELLRLEREIEILIRLSKKEDNKLLSLNNVDFKSLSI